MCQPQTFKKMNQEQSLPMADTISFLSYSHWSSQTEGEKDRDTEGGRGKKKNLYCSGFNMPNSKIEIMVFLSVHENSYPLCQVFSFPTIRATRSGYIVQFL